MINQPRAIVLLFLTVVGLGFLNLVIPDRWAWAGAGGSILLVAVVYAALTGSRRYF